ncbi:MAG: hypothetical protein QM610_09885 [Chitinophagaceae bacterium]
MSYSIRIDKLVVEKPENWHLYDVSNHRTELHNLIGENLRLGQKLLDQYNHWSQRVQAESYREVLKWF